jgi:hypothetical protein
MKANKKGKCDICGKVKDLNVKRYLYEVLCHCHPNYHIDTVHYCDDCKPVKPLTTNIIFRQYNIVTNVYTSVFKCLTKD